jgi:integrase/recombinase XerD
LPAKLTTTIENIDKKVYNNINRELIRKFYKYLKYIDTSENYQNGLIKVIIRFAEYLGSGVTFYETKDKEKILQLLDLKRKTEDKDPDKKWITTWNDYLWRLKYFYRWLHNTKDRGSDARSYDSWITPSFINIKSKRTKRLILYVETEIWDRDELFTVIKYEQYKRNKAALALLLDIDARPHEVTLLKIKHIRLNAKYDEGEIPPKSKTGSGPLLLTFSPPSSLFYK